jgi:hypothetical protein
VPKFFLFHVSKRMMHAPMRMTIDLPKEVMELVYRQALHRLTARAMARARARARVTVRDRNRVRVRVGPLILKATLLAERNRANSNPILNRNPGPAVFAQPWPKL